VGALSYSLCMKDLAEAALNDAQVKGASYADVRLDEHVTQDVIVKNGQLAAVSDDASEGFGVRVLVDGAWGFAGSSRLNLDEVHEVVDRAIRIARASARARSIPVDLGPPVTSRGHYRTPVERDPFSVPLSEKVELLLRADQAMAATKGVTITEGSMEFIKQTKIFASTEGAYTEQEFFESGAGIEATATSPDDVQNRSYPNSFGRHQGAGGYEYIVAMQLDRHGQRIGEEAVALLTAPQCPSGLKTLILDASQTALQIHESCGHPTELDRVFGMEAAYAGTSFMTPEKLNHLRYGSPKVTITADAMTPTGLGTFGWDDEGVPAQRSFLIKEGLFVGYLTSRETASVLGQQSNGTMRADGWNRIPLIRMTNVSLQPGDSSLEQMIADTKDGVYMETNRSWSIDDKRLNFQFGTQLAYEILNGKRGRLLKNATYAGITPEFWNSCDAVAGTSEWRVWGLANCGKGQPPQVAHVAHGAPPARFQNVKVGILK
jgi:TldD protein